MSWWDSENDIRKILMINLNLHKYYIQQLACFNIRPNMQYMSAMMYHILPTSTSYKIQYSKLHKVFTSSTEC